MSSFQNNNSAMPYSPTSSETTDTEVSDSPFQIRTPGRTHRIISIEGNIGSGKSTLLNHLKEALKDRDDVIFLKEPVDEWESIKDKEGKTMLQKFYADQARYSFAFQMMAYISRLALLKAAVQEHPNATFITERSIYVSLSLLFFFKCCSYSSFSF
jgi:deoxyadenosine/deoxycytidine kinase